MDKKYYTVAEFAKKVEVSPQYIYKQTKKQLRNYCKLVEGHKVISESAFSLFAVKNNETTSENESVVVEYLLQQLKEKDGQIALLSEEVRRRSEEILELTKAFREAQALHAGTMQRELTDNNKRKWWKFWK